MAHLSVNVHRTFNESIPYHTIQDLLPSSPPKTNQTTPILAKIETGRIGQSRIVKVEVVKVWSKSHWPKFGQSRIG